MNAVQPSAVRLQYVAEVFDTEESEAQRGNIQCFDHSDGKQEISVQLRNFTVASLTMSGKIFVWRYEMVRTLQQ